MNTMGKQLVGGSQPIKVTTSALWLTNKLFIYSKNYITRALMNSKSIFSIFVNGITIHPVAEAKKSCCILLCPIAWNISLSDCHTFDFFPPSLC